MGKESTSEPTDKLQKTTNGAISQVKEATDTAISGANETISQRKKDIDEFIA